MTNVAVVLLVAMASHETGYPGAVVSGEDPDFAVVPSPASTVERVGVPALFPGCGFEVGEDAPVLALTSEETTSTGPLFNYELRYSVIESEQDPDEPIRVCPSAPLPPASFLIDVGTLPGGRHVFRVDGLFEGEVVKSRTSMVDVSALPSTGVSGAWYAPEQSGRGLFVTRVSAHAGDPAPLIALYWATHDAEGQPVWVLAPAHADGNVAEAEAFTTAGTPLAPGEAQLESTRWGTLRFEYTACSRASLTWDADDPAITDGSVQVQQLAEPDGLAGCRIERFRRHPAAAVR